MTFLRDKIARALSTQTTCDCGPHPSELHFRQADAVLAVLDLDKVRADAAMTDTPTTAHVRRQYARQENYDIHYEGDLAETPDGQVSAAEFNRWLAEEQAEAQVKALRELARCREELEAAAQTGMNEYGGPFAWNAAKGVRDYLYDRADRIARGAGIETGEKATDG